MRRTVVDVETWTDSKQYSTRQQQSKEARELRGLTNLRWSLLQAARQTHNYQRLLTTAPGGKANAVFAEMSLVY